jgi:TonB family protein
MNTARWLLALMIVFSVRDLQGQSIADLEARHKKGEILRVRHLVADSRVRYDEAGDLVGKWKRGQWTWHGTVELNRVELKAGVLKINANRLLLNYDLAANTFRPARTGSDIDIEIRTSANSDLEAEWNKAFLKKSEWAPENIEKYWRPFLECGITPTTDDCDHYARQARSQPDKPGYKRNDPEGVFRVDRGVTPPRIRSKTDPEYTEVARAARVQGTVILEGIVRADGSVSIERIVRPLGWGLEESAAAALSRWRFYPATADGEPVDVILNIEVNFNLRPQ